jgi:hypothetical protein
MKTVVLQSRIKRLGCIWKDRTDYGDADDIRCIDKARQALEMYYKPGQPGTDVPYIKNREWRVAIKETSYHVVAQY